MTEMLPVHADLSRKRAPHSPGQRLYAAMYSAPSRLWAMGVLMVAAFAFGGGSRGDIASLIVLRPLSFLLLAYAVIGLSGAQWRRLGVPGWTALGLALLVMVQLMPLPPQIWTALPGRALPAGIAAAMGWEQEWRPLSLVPSRTLNALFAQGVPLAALALLAGQGAGLAGQAARNYGRIVWLILAIGAVSSLVGLAQLMGAPDGPLYFYRITNEGMAVGLFANRNHHAVFLASLIPLLAFVGLSAWYRRAAAGRLAAMIGAGGATAFLLPMVLVTGSRAGAALALVAGLVVATLCGRAVNARTSARAARWSIARLAAPLLVAGLAALAALTHFASRSLSFERLLGTNMDGDLRADVLPHLWSMAGDYFPFGTGLGAFRRAWEVIEPQELLRPQFLNQAHNDVLQIVIEGGAAGLALLLLALVWLMRSGWQAWRDFQASSARGDAPGMALFSWLALAVLLAGSLFDYPLRTPSLMALAAVLAGITQLALSSPSDLAKPSRSLAP